MLKEPLFTVIIPAYNAEQYIDKSVNSILKNSFENFEIIIVDDGSIDNTKAVCDNLVIEDNRIRYIFQENAGPNVARNNAIEHANGKYLIFLDADDKLAENAMDILWKELSNEEFDFINYGISFINQKTKQTTSKLSHDKKVLTNGEIINAAMMGNGILSVCWSKTINREFLLENNIRFVPDKVHGRDIIFSRILSFKSKKSLIIPDILVCSYEIDDSFSRTFSMKNINSAIQVSNDLIEIFQNTNVNKDLLNYSIYKHLRYIVVVSSFRFDNFSSYKSALNQVKQLFPNIDEFKKCQKSKDYLLAIWLKIPLVSFYIAKVLNKINIRPY